MPAFLRLTVLGNNEYWCNICKQYLPSSRFASSSIARRVSRCRACRTRQELERRNRTVASRLAHKLYEAERKRIGGQGHLIRPDFAQRVFDRYNGQSALSGKTDKLTLHRFWPHLSAKEWNVVLVTETEARVLSHVDHPWERFPLPIVQDMLKELEKNV